MEPTVWKVWMNPLWNSTEKRLRSPWRLVAQVVMHLGGALLIFVILGPLVARLAAPNVEDLSLTGLQSLAMSNLWVRSFALVSQSMMALASVAIALRFIDRRPWSDIGVTARARWIGDSIVGFAVGGMLMAGIFATELALGWVTVSGTFENLTAAPFFLALLVYFLLVVISGFAEELVSRGYQIRNIFEGVSVSRVGPRTAMTASVLASAAVFGVMHALSPNASIVSITNIGIAGVMYGLGYVASGRLGFSTGLHAAWNFFQGNVFGFTTSGQVAQVSILGVTQAASPALWTGGAFGPEAGLLSTIATLSAIGVIVWRRRAWSRDDTRIVSTTAS